MPLNTISLKKEPLIVGISGASGSGKSTLANLLKKQYGEDKISVLNMDDYYKDLSHLTLEQRKKINFDQPDALDLELLRLHLSCLKKGESIEVPFYDFKTNTRSSTGVSVSPKNIIVLEGIFALHCFPDLLDVKIYVDTPLDIALYRRLWRDLDERNLTPNQDNYISYIEKVRPGYVQYIEPSIKQANLIICNKIGKLDIEQASQFINGKLKTDDNSQSTNQKKIKQPKYGTVRINLYQHVLKQQPKVQIPTVSINLE